MKKRGSDLLEHRDLVLLGKKIRQLRVAKGFSQEEFANSIDMNRGYYGTIERGQANISALNLLRVARGLNVLPGDLFPEVTLAKNSEQQEAK